MKVNILIVEGVEGPSCYINDYRVAGNKPWGGGKEMFEFHADEKEVFKALGRHPNQTVEPTGEDESSEDLFDPNRIHVGNRRI